MRSLVSFRACSSSPFSGARVDTKRIVPEWTSLAGNQEAGRAAEEGRRSCERITPVRVREGVLSIFVSLSSVAPRRVKWFLCVVV